jgi:DNA polymerase (family X)
VLSHGETRSSIILFPEIQVDLRVVPPESFGAALHYFTGSKAHNIAVRSLAAQKKLKVNEYGVFRGERRVAGAEEEEIFAAVGLSFLEPELREGRGEIEAAATGTIPRLVSEDDIRGDLHAHTSATDGRASLEEMLEGARARGYEYLAITDHSERLAFARGLDVTRLRRQIREIDTLNARNTDFRLLKGIEVDILEDGDLDLPDEVLSELDIVVCSSHSKFNLPRDKQTERFLRAMDNRYCTIIGHPTGRLLERREPYDIDVERIIEGAKERNVILELNAQPARLDLNDTYCRLAKERGVLLSISTDAHSVGEMDYLRYGIGQARRGWLTRSDVVNTLTLDELLELFRRRR